MALTSAQIVDVRRYMGYSVSGNTTSQPYREPAYSDVTLASLSIDYRLANLTSDEENVLTTTYLPNLNSREQEIQGAASNLDTDQAAVWKRNSQEVSDRINLFNWLRRDLCVFLGFPPGPQLATPNRVIRA
jgi:hypothetical protein